MRKKGGEKKEEKEKDASLGIEPRTFRVLGQSSNRCSPQASVMLHVQ